MHYFPKRAGARADQNLDLSRIGFWLMSTHKNIWKRLSWQTMESMLDFSTMKSCAFLWISMWYCSNVNGHSGFSFGGLGGYTGRQICGLLLPSMRKLMILTLSWIIALSWQRGLCNSIKLWAMRCRATQVRWLIAKSSDQTWPTREGKWNEVKVKSLSRVQLLSNPWTAA